KRIARVCRRQRVAMPYGQKAVLPKAFLVGISAEEYAVVEPLLDTVQEAVSASLLRTAREKQWLHSGPPRVVVQDSETVAEGRPEVISTTLPGPGALSGGGADAPRESTTTYSPGDAVAPGSEPTHTVSASAKPETPALIRPETRPESTHAIRDTPPAAPARPVLVPVTRDLRAEPTAAELHGAGVHRLRGTDGEPDIVLTREALVVGRAEDCDVTIGYPSASRHHLRLVPTLAGCRVEDLDSRHGTRVNGALVRQPVLLRARDTLQLGSMGPCWTYQPLVSTPVMRGSGQAGT
ncbi:MAG: FhaA domain-containing protein, partial [Mycobacteriales bacterium]